MRRLVDTPIWLRLTGAIWLMLAIAWMGMIAWETRVNRTTAIAQAEDFAHSIHEMTMAGLTGMMITGTIGQREVFLDQSTMRQTVNPCGSSSRPWPPRTTSARTALRVTRFRRARRSALSA